MCKGMGKEGKEEKRKIEKGQRLRNGKKWRENEKDPKLKCSSSPPSLYGFRRAICSYQHNPYQAPFSKKLPKSLVLVLHRADVQEIVLSGCLNMRWHQLTSSLLLGEDSHRRAATHGSSVNLLGQPALYLFPCCRDKNKNPLPLTPIKLPSIS